MMREPLSARVKRRVQALYKEGRFSQTDLAKTVGLGNSAIGSYITGDSDISLRVLEGVARVTRVPEAELVVPDGESLKQLDADELRVIVWLRKWPPSVRRSLIDFLTFFANESEDDQQTRAMHELWRRARPREKLRILGLASLEVEKMLYGDTRKELERQLLREDPKPRTESGRRGLP